MPLEKLVVFERIDRIGGDAIGPYLEDDLALDLQNIGDCPETGRNFTLGHGCIVLL
jgi:hypothetical protein